MRLTILNAVMLATTAALTAVNLQPPTADAKVEATHPIFADVGGEMREMQKFDTIQARQIMLVDEKGYPQIQLIAGRNTSGIWISDGKDRNVAIYADKYQGPVISLIDVRNVGGGKGAPLAFSLDGDGKPIVQVVDGKVDIFDAKTLVPKK